MRSPSGSVRSGFDEQSVEAPFHLNPYVTQQEENHFNLQPYVTSKPKVQPYVTSKPKVQQQRPPQWQQQQQQYQQQAAKVEGRSEPGPFRAPHSMKRVGSHRLPRVTNASAPFEKLIAPTSYLHDELSKDEAYVHAMRAGQIWQSLVGQHTRLPALWYDGEDPGRPYLGCPSKRNKWSYVGRHRVAGDPKLNSIVSSSSSSGKLLLHLVVRDSETFEPTEDVVVGVFHPNAEGIRRHGGDGSENAKRLEDCRDVWIGHHSRSVPRDGKRTATRIESLLRFRNGSVVDKSPLGPTGEDKKSSSHHVDNTNMKSVFGHAPPRHTVFVPEHKLHNLLSQQPERGRGRAPPPSVVLMRTFLR